MKSTNKYFVIYWGYDRTIIDTQPYNDLNKAISDCIYWKNHIATKNRIWKIEIAKNIRLNTICIMN